MLNRRRIETLHRVMYESFTPGMMRRAPMRLKQRIAATLEYRLVDELSADAWLQSLCTTPKGELVPMSVKLFEETVGGYSLRPFFSPRFYWRTARRVWRGEVRTPKQQAELERMHTTAAVTFPGFSDVPPGEMSSRRRLREK